MNTTNKFKKRALAIALAGPTAMGITLPAAAQDGQSVLEEVVVTASRREELAIDTPVSLTVFDTSDANRNGITDINSIADMIPNLQATDGGAPGFGNLVIRGTYLGGAPTVGTYLDDVPYGGVVGG